MSGGDELGTARILMMVVSNDGHSWRARSTSVLESHHVCPPYSPHGRL